MIRYNPKIQKRILRLLSDLHREEVAVFTGSINGSDYYIEDILPAVNECTDCSRHFFISNRQINRLMIKAQRRGQILLGIVHTHPDDLPTTPSPADIANCRHAVNAVFQPGCGLLTFFDNHGVLFSRPIKTSPVGLFVPGFSSA